ncbi:MAG: hypothetical protein KGH63_02760 [Candidatus Micrarchaeota archaeon]|nr:hypothetical protein [Candidatus Micrarchaeota archaeon]
MAEKEAETRGGKAAGAPSARGPMSEPKAAEAPKPKEAEGAKAKVPVPAPPKLEAAKAKAAGVPAAKESEAAKPRSPAPEPARPAPGASGSRLDMPLAVSEISVLLDTYDDIFSDFDPRPYDQRELSEDFLKELGRRHLETKKGGYEVHFLIPTAEREPRYEAIIKKRLREHFQHELHDLEGQIKHRHSRGLHHLLIGFGLLAAETSLVLFYPNSLAQRLVSLLLVPGGWFYVWTGMELMLEEPFNMTQQRAFNEKFVRCSYVFVTADPEED